MSLLSASEARELIPGISGTGLDTKLTARIAEAEPLIATFCGWAALTGEASMDEADQTGRVLYYAGSAIRYREGAYVLPLGLFPVTALVLLEDTDGDWSYATTVSASDYVLDQARGEVLFKPAASYTPGRRGPRRFKATLTAGHATAPDELKRLIAETVKHLLGRHKTAGKTSTSSKAGSAALKEQAELIPAVVRMALARRYLLPGVMGVS